MNNLVDGLGAPMMREVKKLKLNCDNLLAGSKLASLEPLQDSI